MAKEAIVHTGKIVSVNPQFTMVEIVSEAACASCHAAGLCGISEYKTKAVEVPTSPTVYYEPGEEVDVVLKASMGHKAVWLAYVAPLVLLLAGILLALRLGAGEGLAALVAVGAVALYYLGIYLLRDKLQDEYIFTIRKKQ